MVITPGWQKFLGPLVSGLRWPLPGTRSPSTYRRTFFQRVLNTKKPGQSPGLQCRLCEAMQESQRATIHSLVQSTNSIEPRLHDRRKVCWKHIGVWGRHEADCLDGTTDMESKCIVMGRFKMLQEQVLGDLTHREGPGEAPEGPEKDRNQEPSKEKFTFGSLTS